MRAKEYLSQVRFLDERITCKLADAARLQDMATRITPVLREDGVSGGGGAPDRLADAVARIVDLKAEINRDIDRLVDKKRDIAAKLGLSVVGTTFSFVLRGAFPAVSAV